MPRQQAPPVHSNGGAKATFHRNGGYGASAVDAAAAAAAYGASPAAAAGTSLRGPKQLSDTRYSSVSSSVLSLANDLRALGVDALLEVPTLVIAGDQSSGKSSVVEAVAGVPLPRADGTCTRCPTEVRMRRRSAADSSPWSCTVKLARGRDDTGGSAAATGQPLEEAFCTVYDKSHISPAVTAAQAVLLNPSHVAQHPSGTRAFVPLFPAVNPPMSAPSNVAAAAATAANGSGAPNSASAGLVATTATDDFADDGDGSADEPLVLSAAPNGNHSGSEGFPVRHSAAYGSLPSVQKYERQFTMDRVVLEIDGADADLTIVDLPGVIHNHADGTQHVEVVKAMVRRQLEPQHHIIVMTLPAMLDQETQVIRLWAREVDPAGQRTIGVITKPDMVPEGQSSMHRKIIDLVSATPPPPTGTQQPQLGHSSCHPHARAAPTSGNGSTTSSSSDGLRLGCYVVKNPPQEAVEAGITFAAARELERSYFAGSPHWAPAMAASSQLASRLGADNLRDGLSALLVGQIQQQLPEMRKRVQRRLVEVKQQLDGLPPPPSADPLRELRLLLRQAAERLDQELNGAHGQSKECVQEILGLYDKFGSKVMRSTPAFLVGGKLVGALSQEDKGLGEAAGAAAAAAANVSSRTQLSEAAMAAGGHGAAVGKLQQLMKLDANGDADLRAALDEYSKTAAVAAAAGAGGGRTVYGGLSERALYDMLSDPGVEGALDRWGFAVDDLWTLGEVQQVLREHRGCELPTFPSYDALVDLIGRFKGRWGSHAAECVDDVAVAVHDRAAAVAAELFGRFPRAHSAVGAELGDYVDSLVQEVQAEVAQMVKIEDGDVFVMGEALFRDQEAAFRSRLKKAYQQREDAPVAAAAAGETDEEREKLRKLEAERDKKLEEALRLLKDYGGVSFGSFEEVFMAQRTPVDDELHMMAACLAYFKSAFQRFKAAVPMRIRGRLLKRVVDPDGVEEAIVRRLLVRRAGGRQVAAAAAEAEEAPLPGSRPGGVTQANFDELESQWEVARELLSEGEGLAAQRRTLQDVRERLRGAAERLAGVAF